MRRLAKQEAVMNMHAESDFEPEELDEALDDELDEAGDWDEETLGLDWSEADELRLVREVVPGTGLD